MQLMFITSHKYGVYHQRTNMSLAPYLRLSEIPQSHLPFLLMSLIIHKS